jgi:hypothetical protein
MADSWVDLATLVPTQEAWSEKHSTDTCCSGFESLALQRNCWYKVWFYVPNKTPLVLFFFSVRFSASRFCSFMTCHLDYLGRTVTSKHEHIATSPGV